MPHQIETYGNQAAFASRLDAWHQLGTTLGETFTAEQAMEVAHLGGWDVRKLALTATEMDDNGVTSVDVPNSYATARTNPFTGATEALGTVGPKYVPVQNEEHVEFLNALVDDTGAHLETAGSLRGGTQVFITCKLPEHMLVGGQDKVDTYLSVVNSHDGSTGFKAMVSPIRVVCANTLNAAVASAQQSWSIRHTKGARSSIEQARQSLDLSFRYAEQFEAEAERMIQETLSAGEWDRTLTAMFGESDREDTSRKGRNLVSKLDVIRDLYASGPTLDGVRGTRWGAYNAITEYMDHHSKVRGAEGAEGKRALRAIDGDLVRVKQHAFDLLRVPANA